MRAVINYIMMVTVCLIFSGSPALADKLNLDFPHNASNTINCWDCHYTTANPAAWAGHSPLSDDDTPYNNLCWTCHNDIVAKDVSNHSSLVTSNKYGDWTMECKDCHWAHQQDQLRISGADAYLYTATTAAASATTLTRSGGAAWTADQYKGYIVVPNINQVSYNYQIASNTEDAITVNGSIDLTKLTAGSDTMAIVYSHNIKSTIKTPNSGLKTARFFDKTGVNSYAMDESATGTDPTPTGICQVCHTKTTHWRNDGTLSAIGAHTNENGTNCIECHLHANGFAHNGDGTGAICGTCHSSNKHPQHLSGNVPCSGCHDLNNMWAVQGVTINNPLDPANNAVCAACHKNIEFDSEGGVLHEHDAGFIAGWTDPGYTLGCDGCHGGRPDGDPNTGEVTMSSNGHAKLVGDAWIRHYPCYYCHSTSVDADSNLTALHANGTADVQVDNKWRVADQSKIPTYDPATMNCTNTYCHSDGTTVDPEMYEYHWDAPPKGCNGCHGHNPADGNCTQCHLADEKHTFTPEKKWISAMPMYENTGPGTPKANSHFRHLFTGFSCDECHATTVVGACSDCHADGIPAGAMGEAQHVNGTVHLNTKKTVVFKQGGIYSDNTCSGTACHSGINPVWGGTVTDSITCMECHRNDVDGTDVDDFGAFNGSQAKINFVQWAETGHGRPDTGNPETDKYAWSNNPPANLPGIGCWYCHDNTVLHMDESNPYRLRKHPHFINRFQKECVYCHMVGEDTECLSCHENSESLAIQLDTITYSATVAAPYTETERPAHSAYTGTWHESNDCAECHYNDGRRHKTEAGLWSQDQKDDVENSYVMMGVCLKCHDDDSAGLCTSCHADPADDPNTPDVDESLKYQTGFDPGMPGTTRIQPQQAKASSFHFGYKHYVAYEESVAGPLGTGTASADAAFLTQLTDSAKSYSPNEWVGYTLMLPDRSSGHGESRKIKTNTADSFELEKNLTTAVLSGESYKIIDPVWKGGKFCWDCHDPHGDDNIYMIQNKVATRTDGTFGKPITRKDVVFDKKQSGTSYAQDSGDPVKGICNVCHTAGTQHYSASGGDSHNKGRICTTCHEHRFTDSHSSGDPCNTCHENKPVPRHSGFGLPRDCTKCHEGVVAQRMDVMGQLRSKSHHIQGKTVSNQDCYACHWEAQENGLINNDHHEGYNYKTHASLKNKEVDLVIWTHYDTADSTDDYSKTVGSRPTTYTPTTNPANPDDLTTVVSFLASNISGQGLPAQRAEVDKVSMHCLGCHSDQNNDAIPFNDCKSPRQYAWDRSSVGARYSNTATATWGKYTNDVNAAQKNIGKAFSAHGNAVNNGGGYHVTDGEDKTITNTRNGTYNVQCYDCHSSHGSKVLGVTSSYVTFNGTRNGANLKETQGGVGGYGQTYFASENDNAGAINPYAAGAGQCFDCHESATVGSFITMDTESPWGYNETFGATAPILGYRDSLKFGQSSRGINTAFPFKQSTILGGHLKASAALGTPAMSTIDGLCTPCHDPHGVSPTLGDDMKYGVPLLKGTWLSSPYKEDKPASTTDGSGADVNGLGGNNYYTNNRFDWSSFDERPPPNRANGTDTSSWRTDRNTFNQVDMSQRASQPAQWDRISETPEQFAGLCLGCHPKESLTTEASDEATETITWESKERIHRTVKGWGWTNGGTPREHAYPCSKCHSPHVSALPRLMKTNCLEYSHRGKVASGGVIPTTTPESYDFATGRFPFGWWTKQEVNPYSTAICHGAATANGSAGWPNNQGWNNLTEW